MGRAAELENAEALGLAGFVVLGPIAGVVLSTMSIGRAVDRLAEAANGSGDAA